MRKCVLFGSLLFLATSVSSCQRTTREVWEDTKTCSRYMGKGVRTLMGNHNDPYGHTYKYDYENQEDFLVLVDEDLYEEVVLTDYGTGIQEESYPLSQESPGDPGCTIPGIDGFKEPIGKLVEIFQRIHFDTDQYAVQGRDNLEIIQKIAHYLAAHPGMYVFVEGHADERGPSAYNLALGSRRANSIRTSLIQNGVHPDQLFTISFGKEQPLALGHETIAWQQNRRGQFKLYER